MKKKKKVNYKNKQFLHFSMFEILCSESVHNYCEKIEELITCHYAIFQQFTHNNSQCL